MQTQGQLVKHLAGTPDGQAMLWLVAQGGTSHGRPDGYSDSDQAEAKQRLRALGLLTEEVSIVDEWELTSLGRHVGQELKDAQTSGPLRRAAVQKSMLHWLYADSRTSTADFVGTSVTGIPVTDRETLEAASFMKKNELISGIGTWQGAHILRPEIQYLGIEAKDDPRTPFDFVQQGGTTIYDSSNNVTISGGNNAGIQAGNQNHQEVNARFSARESAAIGQLLAQLSEELRGLKAAGHDVVRTEAAVEEMTMVMEATSPIRSAVVNSFGTFMAGLALKMTDPAFQGILQMAQNLGGLIMS